MKRFIILFVLSLFVSNIVNAQITISNATYKSSPGIDSLIGVTDLKISNFRGENQKWDVSFTGNDFYYNQKKSASNSAFPSLKFSIDSIFDIIAANRGIYRNDFYVATDNYYGVAGFECKSQSYFIGDLTSNSKDSISLDSYIQKFDNPLVIYKFPMSYPYVNSSSCIRDINTKLTITNFMLNKAKATKRTYYSLKDSVIAWGTFKLRWLQDNQTGYNSDDIPVLLIKRETITLDSVLLNDAPAPAMLLNAFGLTQGALIKSYQYLFLSGDYSYPIVRAISNSADMKDFQYIYINRSALKYKLGIENETDDIKSVKIYPNPCTENVEITSPDIIIQNLTIYNCLGDLIKNIETTGDLQKISVSDLSNGTYFLRINNLITKSFNVFR